jgi:hypothetical protein
MKNNNLDDCTGCMPEGQFKARYTVINKDCEKCLKTITLQHQEDLDREKDKETKRILDIINSPEIATANGTLINKSLLLSKLKEKT